MIRFQFSTKDYHCNKLGVTVTISEKMAIRQCEQTGEVRLTLFGVMDCSHKSKCGVAKPSEDANTCSWNECLHPLLRNQ